jgi:hypothetical protein
MIHHASLPANDPRSAAETLAKIMGGEAMPFPVLAGAWIAWSGDGVTELEIIPREHGYTRNSVAGKEPIIVKVTTGHSPSGWHVAISTDVPASEVVAIARAAGWPAEICDRAGYFSLVEVWVDDATAIEVLDPEMLARYRQTFTAKTWKDMLSEMPVASEGADTIEQLRKLKGRA